jgi:hypothetical protein
MFPLCLPFFKVRLLTGTAPNGAGEKENRAGNLPVSRDPSTAVER